MSGFQLCVLVIAAYPAVGWALLFRIDHLRKVHPAAKTLPTTADFALALPALQWAWSDAHEKLGDAWASRLTWAWRITMPLAILAMIVAVVWF